MKLTTLESNHFVLINESTGLPTLIGRKNKDSEMSVQIDSEIKIETGGHDRRNPVGGIEFYDTEMSSIQTLIGKPFLCENEKSTLWVVPTKIDEILININYSFNKVGPAISIGLEVVGHQDYKIRNIFFNFSIELGSQNWQVFAPGNGLRSGINLQEIKDSTGISPMGGLRGSSGLVYLHEELKKKSLATWFDASVEIPEIEIRSNGNTSLDTKIVTNFGSDLTKSQRLNLSLFSMELDTPPWSEFVEVFQSWLDEKGVTSPAAPPDWVKSAMIFEAQIGYSIFAEVNKYSPYPTVRSLIDDLGRIKGLGFSCIQLMPKQPYPSYNIHDYWDIDVSYGPKAEVFELVQKAHQLGIKVILDVLLHGVLDKESITEAADGVRQGPYKDRIGEKTYDSFSSDVKDSSNYYIAWSRHIIDFENSWRDGSPQVSPLIAEHPDWFYRDTRGAVTGVYTKAFDARNASWQRFFMDGMIFLMKELQIDGFRFDAPTYNDYPNWADWASGRAGSSALGCVGLFQRLRPEIKSLKSDALMYTEPSGHLLRKSMDLNYNYDEQWLVTAIASSDSRRSVGIRNGRELARWMSDRDQLLPRGSMTAHHIDSHDTFWWPSWGIKWRREQFGLEMTRLLTCIFGSLPGPFMMFIGGEVGIDQLLPKISKLKLSEAYQYGETRWWDSDSTPEELFGITYQNFNKSKTMLVNTSQKAVNIPLSSNFKVDHMEELVGEVICKSDELVLGPQSAAIISS